MFKMKKIKIITFVFTLLVCLVSLSTIYGASYSRGSTKVQFGWDKKTPEDGSTIEKNTGGAIWYSSARIDGYQAYCMDYLKKVPGSGTLNHVGDLNVRQLAILKVGKDKGNANATQLALWKYSSGIDYRTQIEATTYFKSGVTKITKSQLNQLFNVADTIYNEAANYTTSDFTKTTGKKATINIDKSEAKKQIKDGYLYKGPYKITTDSGNAIAIAIENNPSGVLVVGSVGSTTALNKVPSNGVVYLKVLLSNGSGSSHVKFATNYTLTKKVTYGEIYSNGDSSYQRLAIIKEKEEQERYIAKNGITINYTLKGSLKIIKISDSDSTPLKGAVFSLFKSKTGDPIQTKTTGDDGTITFDNLDYGTYYVKEMSAPTGYSISTSGYIEKVVNGDEELTVKNKKKKEKGSITIIKKSDTDAKLLSGAVFELYKKKSDAPIQTKTTGSDGTVTFDNLDYGTYYVKEKKAPTGYVILKSDFITIKIDEENSDKEEVVKNHYVQGRVKIKKVVEMAGEEITPDAGDVTFTIYSSNGVQVDQMTVNANGVATSNYLPLGSYYLKETSVNTSYMKINSSKKISFKITEADDGKTIDLNKTVGNFVNEGITGQLQIYKYAIENGTKTPIPNAKFKIYKLISASGGTATSNLEEVATIDTNVKGMAYLYDLKDGTYAYQEVYVPDGYVMDNTIKLFGNTISKTNKILSADVENSIKKGSIQVNKTILDSGKRLSGVEITLFASNKTTVIKKVVTGSSGVAYFGDIKFGTYWIKETNAPDNVIMDTEFYEVKIGDKEGETDFAQVDIKNKLIELGIKLYKVDDNNNPIKGVKFILYSDLDGKNKVAEATTDENGLALFDNLKEGTYYYKEVSAPEGYITVKSEEMKPIKIGYDKNIGEETIHTETIENKQIKGKVKITKVSEDNLPIEGAEFDIKDSNGDVVDHLITNKDGIATSKDLKKGNYTIVETKVPKNYILKTESIDFAIVTDGKTEEKRIVNEYNKGYIEIKKVDSETKKFISGAVFEIYKVDDNGKATKVDTISNYNDKGVGKSKELKNGKYYFVETVAPKNAILDSTKHEFEITDDNKQFEFTIENTIKKGQIKLIKKDDLGNAIKDVKFELLDSKKNVLETLTTNENGEAISKKYALGTYYLRETYTPEEYNMITDLVEVKIKEDNKIVEVQKEIVNKRKLKGQIKLIKKDDLGNAIKDVKFELLDSKKNVLETLTTNESGEAISKKYELGTYYLREIYTPELYVPITKLVPVKIEKENDVVVVEKDIVNNRIIGGIKIIKKDDAGTPIPNVEFSVYKEGSTFAVKKITTNEQGIAITTDLELGKYYFVETKVPDNLNINTEKVSFEITKQGDLITKEVVNERVKGKLIINKTNAENGTGIEGVVFEIYDENQTKLGSIVTDLEGIATTESLKDKDGNKIELYTGKYYYAEVAAPDRFYFEATMHEFNIVKGQENVTLNIENTPFKIPQTGGIIGTDTLIVIIVSIVSITGYIVGNILVNRRHFE